VSQFQTNTFIYSSTQRILQWKVCNHVEILINLSSWPNLMSDINI